MNERAGYLAAFVDALASGKTESLERIVKAAYKVGASREELLVAVKVACSLATVPRELVGQAETLIDEWDRRLGFSEEPPAGPEAVRDPWSRMDRP